MQLEGSCHCGAVSFSLTSAHPYPYQRCYCSISPEWPDLVHPFASVIDTPLPVPPEHTHVMLGSKAAWVEVQTQPADRQCEVWPEESIAQWHERLGLSR